MPAVRLARASREDLLRQASLLAGLAAWFVYTRFFWPLHGVHATLPPCPFLALTGHPCPLCGGTRSFAAMWRGDVVAAVHYHPLGPALFVGAIAAGVVLAALVASRRRLDLAVAAQSRLYVAGLGVLVAAWALRLVLLPLPAT